MNKKEKIKAELRQYDFKKFVCEFDYWLCLASDCDVKTKNEIINDLLIACRAMIEIFNETEKGG